MSARNGTRKKPFLGTKRAPCAREVERVSARVRQVVARDFRFDSTASSFPSPSLPPVRVLLLLYTFTSACFSGCRCPKVFARRQDISSGRSVAQSRDRSRVEILDGSFLQPHILPPPGVPLPLFSSPPPVMPPPPPPLSTAIPFIPVIHHLSRPSFSSSPPALLSFPRSRPLPRPRCLTSFHPLLFSPLLPCTSFFIRTSSFRWLGAFAQEPDDL